MSRSTASFQADRAAVERALGAREADLKRASDELRATLQSKDFLAKVLLDRQTQIKELEVAGEKTAKETRELRLELEKARARADASTQVPPSAHLVLVMMRACAICACN